MKIFLGYASENTETAREIYSFLKTINDDVWFDKVSLIGGDDWDRERAAAQQNADFVVHLISSEVFARAGVVNREIKQTIKLVEDQPIGASYVVFMRLDELRMPAELIRFQYIDHFRDSWRDQLAQAVAKRSAQLGGAVAKATLETTTTVTEKGHTEVGAQKLARVESAVTTEFYIVSSDHIQYPTDGVYWDFVNARLASESLGGFVGAITDFKRLDEDEKKRIKERNLPHEWGLTMQEFFRRGDFLSVRSSLYWYGGGVHPNHGITTLNFLGPDYGLCRIQDLLGRDDDKAFRLVEYCKKVLLAMFDGEGLEDFITRSFEDRRYTWNLASQFNFDDRGLTINFSPYDILPYAFGSHEVFVPWRFVESMLDDRFADLESKLNG